MKKITKAIIPAAGLGTRFLPATKAMPKEMLPIIDTPNIQYIVEEAVKAGISDILVIISDSKESIRHHFESNEELEQRLISTGKTKEAELIRNISKLANVSYAYQNDPTGLGAAILYAEDFVNGEDFAVMLGDDLIDSDEKPAIGELIEVYENTNGSTVLGCQRVERERLKKYGVVKPKGDYSSRVFEVVDMVEKPKDPDTAPSDVAVLGRYVLPNRIFDTLRETKPGVGGEIQLTDAIKASVAYNPCYACIFTGERYDIGDKFGFIKATIDYALKREDLGPQVKEYIESLVSKE